MLPYHLRPPQASRNNTKNDKKKKKNAKVVVCSSTKTTNKNSNGGDDDDAVTTGDGAIDIDNDAFLFRNNGGPIQQAALRDLRELRPDFLQFLNNNNDDNDNDVNDSFAHHNHHTKPGIAFGVFREVFHSAKIAALHSSSRFVAAHRSDVNAHAQLLYAACFQLLHEPFQQQQQNDGNDDYNAQQKDDNQQWAADDPSSLLLVLEQHSIYAIFCLFALYETNPLPLAPSSSITATRQQADSSSNILSTLPCGLRDRENPKLVYRRQYRQGIRIDRKAYARLLQVQEMARAQIASCQFSSSSSSSSSCHCGAAAAMDVLFVLDRLWSKLILSEYTGPRGLEGLAGHEDYPFPSSIQDFDSFIKSRRAAARTTAINADTAKLVQEIMSASGSSSQADVANDNDDKTDGNSTALLFSDSLQNHLQTYLSARRSIRLPLNKNAAAPATTSRLVQERIRKALQPMFDHGQQKQQQKQRTDPFLQIVNNASTMTMMQHPAKGVSGTSFAAGVTFARDDPNKHNNDDNDDDNDSNKPRALEAGQGNGEEPSGNNGDDSTDGITRRQHNDVAESYYKLIIPDNLPASLRESITVAVRTLVDRDQDSFLTPQQQPQTAAVSAARATVDDDESAATVDYDYDDDDGGSGSGGGAGHEALAALIAQAASLGTAGQTKNTGVAFLDSTRGELEDEGRISGMRQRGRQSQQDDDDDLSNASSTVGQRALEDLLTITMAMGKSAATVEHRKQPASKRGVGEPRKRARKGKRARKNIEVDMEQDTSVDEDSAEDSEEEEEVESVGGEGNAALELLIGRAMM